MQQIGTATTENGIALGQSVSPIPDTWCARKGGALGQGPRGSGMGLGFRRATSHGSVLYGVLCDAEREGEHVLPQNSSLGTKKSPRLGKKENISLPSEIAKKVQWRLQHLSLH